MQRKCQSCGSVFYAVEDWKKACLDCFIKSKSGGRAPPPRYRPPSNNDDVDHNMLKRMIYLCHPDKHGQSEMSLIVTKFLLDKKKEYK